MSGTQTPPSRYGRGWQAIVVTVVVVLVLAVIALLTTDSENPGSTDARPSPAPSSAGEEGTGEKGDVDVAGCPPRGPASTELPETAPAAEWTLTQGLALPVSKTAGPLRVDGDVARCYAHTPEGALLAAAQITARMVIAEDWETVLRRQATGDGLEELIAKRKKYEEEQGDVAPVPGDSMGQYVGYQWVTADEDLVVLELVTRFEKGQLQASPVTMRWQAGDWVYDGSGRTSARSLRDLGGYVPWSGVS
ncbi:hypothetical protein ABT357_27195 [Streptomyces albidoflavus]|uniref:hypothetical protein n=1 Tax=Streptomyces albidoflavus TaxID=1886 RepID=UPI0033335A2C